MSADPAHLRIEHLRLFGTMEPSETAGEPLASTTANPDRTAATVDYSGLQPHPVVAAILDRVRDVERINIQPGEVLAIGINGWITDQDAAQIRHVFAEVLPGVRTVVMQDAELRVISAALADEVEAAGTDNTTRTGA